MKRPFLTAEWRRRAMLNLFASTAPIARAVRRLEHEPYRLVPTASTIHSRRPP
ncbi:MAG: hypothetical protein U0574_09570 [Phycisphaerales bacterium]